MTSSSEFDRDVLETVVDEEGPPRWRRLAGAVTVGLSVLALGTAYTEWMLGFLGREFVLGGGLAIQGPFTVGLLAAMAVGYRVGDVLAVRLWLTPAERALRAAETDDADVDGA